jgi:hypothetical protein
VPNPYIVGTKLDPETRQPIYETVNVRETPITIAVITGDVVQNLRSALDHLAYHLVWVGIGRQPTGREARDISFPIIDTESPTEYETARERKVMGMRKDAIEAIDALKPYKGGDDLLWPLHKLNNIDKHRMLITVGSAYRSANLTPLIERNINIEALWPTDDNPVFPDLPDLFYRVVDRRFPLKAGYELWRGAPDEQVNQKMKFIFEVAFGESGIIEGKPLLETLQQMTELVDNIIAGFKPLLA